MGAPERTYIRVKLAATLLDDLAGHERLATCAADIPGRLGGALVHGSSFHADRIGTTAPGHPRTASGRGRVRRLSRDRALLP